MNVDIVIFFPPLKMWPEYLRARKLPEDKMASRKRKLPEVVFYQFLIYPLSSWQVFITAKKNTVYCEIETIYKTIQISPASVHTAFYTMCYLLKPWKVKED